MLGSNCLSKEFANTKNKFTSNNLPQAWQWLCFLLLFCSAHTLESLFKHGDGPPTFVDQVSSFSTPQQDYCILALCQPHAVQFLATRSGKFKKTVRQSISNCSHQVLQVEYKTPSVPHAVPVHRNIIHHIKFLLIEASCKQPQCLGASQGSCQENPVRRSHLAAVSKSSCSDKPGKRKRERRLRRREVP